MRKGIKIGIALLVVALILTAGAFFLPRDVFKIEHTDEFGWSVRAGAICYLDKNGKPLLGWQEIEGNRYYFVPDAGIRATDWIQIGTNRYYFDENGIMQTGWQTIAGKQYYFAEDGRVVTGWTEVDGIQYCFGKDGVALEGWFEDETGKYYLDEKGVPAVGLQEIDGKRYWFDEDGRPVTGWMEQDGEKYYCKEDGEVAVGQVEIDGVNHFFTSKGKYVLLVNRENPVPDTYELNLVGYGEYQMDSDAKVALEQMRKDCPYPTTIDNIYRSKEQQEHVWNSGVKRRMALGMTKREAEEETAKWAMTPGHSEHQTGLAVDLFGSEEARKWMEEHCWDYGFIVRYPEGKAEFTGIAYEYWHFRYVGTELALELKELGMCMEEYMQMLTE
ncbi:MAG: D-alanyl-D-alanine carboxypeptidase family protein [Oscillospiraceae bacterium]|nr:D-alanyl-D-alanine carboxypeptidase family protein [Oscillospiraceae bacterium]